MNKFTEIPDGDRLLVKKLQALIDQTRKLNTDLYANPRPGCACDGKSICAHHADVYTALEKVQDDLALAIHKAGRIE